jgi:hypothetical protein
MNHLLFLLFFFAPFLCVGWIKFEAFMGNELQRQCLGMKAAFKGCNLTLPPNNPVRMGTPISKSARTSDSLRTLPNRSSALRGQWMRLLSKGAT